MGFLKRVRRNHALEHATIAIAHARMAGPGALAGNSTGGGFFVYGDVPTPVLSKAASEALERLKAGESDLAISPFCGTNLVVAATLTGLSCVLAMGHKRRWRRVPEVVTTALVALLASRAIGHQVQRHVTTDGAVGHLRIRDISRLDIGGLTIHRVSTSSKEQ